MLGFNAKEGEVGAWSIEVQRGGKGKGRKRTRPTTCGANGGELALILDLYVSPEGCAPGGSEGSESDGEAADVTGGGKRKHWWGL